MTGSRIPKGVSEAGVLSQLAQGGLDARRVRVRQENVSLQYKRV